MSWEVEYTDGFGEWWNSLNEAEQKSVAKVVGVLAETGPSLSYPYSSDISQAKHRGMRELRIQHQGRPYRVLYAFDPRRTAILLIGGDKTGNERWYEVYLPIADKLFEEHLTGLKEEQDDG